MKDLTKIGEELFNKLRGRFPSITIGDQDGNVTNEPTEARFFDFDYMSNNNTLGKVSISLDEEGVAVIYSKDFITTENEVTKTAWYNFLKELRFFARKRLLNFDTRDINKSNLNKRDYKFLANRSGDNTMNESKLYGTSRVSYQNIGEARIMIKHTESVDQESVTGRTQKIGKIYIESPEGERFKYPYKHLSGARAMARHVAEGGNAYDDFGKHIVGLSEEMGKLRKFKNYMGRSAVMAEGLAGYVDIVKERIATVKKTIENLQKPAYYAETFAAFETPVMEDVPSDVAENWIDELTIKQFNEELQDIFPYIYNLVKEGTKAVELGPDDLVDESALMAYAGKKKHGAEYMKKAAQAGREGASQEELGKLKDKYSKAEKTKEEIALEQGFEEMMGQFSEAANDCDDTCPKSCPDCGGTGDPEKYKEMQKEEELVSEDELPKSPKVLKLVIDDLEKFKAEQDEAKKQGYDEDVRMMQSRIDDLLDIANLIKDGGPIAALDTSVQDTIVDYYEKAGEPLPFAAEGNAYANAVRQAKKDGKKKGDKIDGPDGDEITIEKDEKTPLGEFILSYFDRENGQFPKGETAVLTMVEKDYGEQFIEPAKAFIEQVTAKFDEWQMRSQPQQMEEPDMQEGQYDGKSREELLKMKAEAEASIKNMQSSGNDPQSRFYDETQMMMAQQHLDSINKALDKVGEATGDFDRMRELAGLR